MRTDRHESLFLYNNIFFVLNQIRSHMAYRSALQGFTGKSGAYEKSLEVSEILHMGCAIGKTGLACRRRPVDPLLLYHIEASLSIGKTAQKNCPLFGQFDELTVKCGTQAEITSQSQSSKKISHCITTYHLQNPQGCIRLRFLHPRGCKNHSFRNSYSKQLCARCPCRCCSRFHNRLFD